MEDGLGYSDEALHGHCTREKQGAQTVEHHAHPEDVADDAVRVKSVPLPVKAVDVQHKGAIDEVTQQVSGHQAAGKEQEGCLGLDAVATVGFDQNEESEAVGEDAHRHGDDGCSDRQLLMAAGGVGISDL